MGWGGNSRFFLFEYSCFSILDCVSVISGISLVSAANLSSTEPAVIILGLRLKGQDHLPTHESNTLFT